MITEGPWIWNECYNGLSNDKGETVLNYADYEGMWVSYYTEKGKANGQAISAVPDMIKALKACLLLLDASEDLRDTYPAEVTRVALEKAGINGEHMKGGNTLRGSTKEMDMLTNNR